MASRPDLEQARPVQSAAWRSRTDGRLWVSLQRPEGPQLFVPAGVDDVDAVVTSGVWLIGELTLGAPATVVVWADVVKTTGAAHSAQAVELHNLVEVPEDELDQVEDELTFRPWWSRCAGAALLLLVVVAVAAALSGWDRTTALPVLAAAAVPLYLLSRARIDLDSTGGSAVRFGGQTRWAWADVAEVAQVDGAVRVTIGPGAVRLPDWPPTAGRERLAAAIRGRAAAATAALADPHAWRAVG